MLVTAVDVVDEANDHARLIPMLQQAEDTTGIKAQTTVADYHSGSNLEECGGRDQQVVMPEAATQGLKRPYHKDRFTYDEVPTAGLSSRTETSLQGYEAHSWHTHARVPCLSDGVSSVPGIRGLYQRPTPWTSAGDRTSRRGAA